MTRIARAALLTLTSIALASPAWAQTNADRIRALVKDGQKVVIIADQGREVRGRISSIRADGLQLVVDRQTTMDMGYADIVRIDHPHDTLSNGGLTGLGVGAAFGLIAVALDDCRSFFGCPEGRDYVLASLLLGGMGSAIGVGVDALIRRDRAIYQRGLRTTVTPVVAPGLTAAVVSVSW